MRFINTDKPIAIKPIATPPTVNSTRSVNRIMTALTVFVLLSAISLSAFVLIGHNRSPIEIMQGIDHQQQRLLEQRP